MTKTIAILGQPNCGKTSLFNRLTGSNQHVANWAGVTVEKKEGHYKSGNNNINVIDLPGIYSLSTYSLEEIVTRNYLLNEKPDLILNIVDSTNLERQLFLTIQLLFFGHPVVLVLNMADEAESKGITFDIDRLTELLGIPVIKTIARESKEVNQLKDIIDKNLTDKMKLDFKIDNDLIFKTIKNISVNLNKTDNFKEFTDWFALKIIEDDKEILNKIEKENAQVLDEINLIKIDLEKSSGKKSKTLVTDWIYGITRGIVKETVFERKNKNIREIVSNFLDLIALNKYAGIPVFFLIIFIMFQFTFISGDFFIGYLKSLIHILSGFIEKIPNETIRSLLKNGILSGVGNVLLLIPYIFFMFFFLSILEDTGYIARAAFVMDRFMHKIGLHGKSFIPLVLGFGCNVPAIMATRSLESHEERIKTILMIPFISCSGRLPVFVLLSGAFFGKYGGIAVFILYLTGITVSVLTGLILNKTYLPKKSQGLIMELPPYRIPHLTNSIIGTWPKIKHYLEKAGTLIFVASIILWVLSYFPLGVEFGGEKSLISYAGKILGVILLPLGFDWKMSLGLISGFAAKEIIISTLSILYSGNIGTSLASMISPVVAFSYLVFILLYTPCLATIAVVRSETNSLKWTVFSVVYGIAFAWGLSFIITNLGQLVVKLLISIK